jgi:hypothetical protein
MSADQHNQIGIRRGATSFNMRTVCVKLNDNIEKPQVFKGDQNNKTKLVAALS